MRTALLFTFAALALVLAPGAAAAPPPNDAFESASVVGAVPFSTSVDLAEATTQSGEPQACTFKTRTAWYRFEPATNMPVRIGLGASAPGVTAALWRSFGGIFNLSFEGCVFGGTTTLNAQAGGVYYIQVGNDFSAAPFAELTVEPIPPPSNDDLADAKQVGGLPYADAVPMLASTVEPGEPNASVIGTAWWSVTAQEDASLLIGDVGCCGNTIVNVYTGSGIGALDPVPVARSFGRTIFQATAGTNVPDPARPQRALQQRRDRHLAAGRPDAERRDLPQPVRSVVIRHDRVLGACLRSRSVPDRVLELGLRGRRHRRGLLCVAPLPRRRRLRRDADDRDERRPHGVLDDDGDGSDA